MNALLISREDRAYHVLKVCEYAARGLVPDLDDVEDETMGLLAGCFGAFATKILYLMPRASAQWKPEFEAALSSSHSMRVERIELPRKTALSGVTGKCMACGRTERNCRYAIDLAGSLDPNAWLKGPDKVMEQYSEFKEEYATTLRPSFASQWMRSKQMPDTDKGCFVVGQTCLRKAKLRYLLQSMLLDACYNCERDIEDLIDDGEEGANLSSDTLYTLSSEKCEEFVKAQDAIELAVADEKRPVPEVRVDHDFWDIIDECRNEAAEGREDVFNKIIRDRAIETLTSLRSYSKRQYDRKDDEEYIGSSDDDVEDDDSEDEVCNKRKRVGSRTCVIQDESDDESHPQFGPVTRSSKRQRQSAPASTSVAQDAEPAEPVEPGPSGSNGRRDDERRNRSLGKSTSASVSDMVGRQRAAGILPSRNDALVQLMELQARLARSFNHRDATVCTNAILTLQELMQRVEDLAHTAGI